MKNTQAKVKIVVELDAEAQAAIEALIKRGINIDAALAQSIEDASKETEKSFF